METSEKSPILAWIEREGGHTLPPSQSPMRVQAFPHGFVYSLRGSRCEPLRRRLLPRHGAREQIVSLSQGLKLDCGTIFSAMAN